MQKKQFTISSLPKKPKLNIKQCKYQQVTLTSNYYVLKWPAKFDKTFYQYSIQFEPEIPKDARKVREALMQKAQKEFNKEGIYYYLIRGRVLWTLNKRKQETKKIQIQINGSTYELILKEVKYVLLQDIKLQDKKNGLLQILNAQLKRHLIKSGLKEIGKQSIFYNTNQVTNLENFSIFSGFKTTIHVIRQEVPALLIDYQSKIIRKNNVYHFLKNCSKEERQQLIGKSVVATYGNYSTYVVHQICSNMKPKDCFFHKALGNISYIQYYNQNYKINIQFENQPMLKHLRKQKNAQGQQETKQIYLIPQLVYLTGLQEKQRNNFQLMKQVAQKTKLNPSSRMSKINACKNNLQKLSASQQNIFIISSQNKVKGYLLNTPVIEVSNSNLKIRNGQFQLKEKVKDPLILKQCIIVFDQRAQKDVDFMVKKLQQASKTFGINLGEIYDFTIKKNGDKADVWKKQILQDIKNNGPANLYICALNKFNRHIYSELKQFFIHKIGKVSQMVNLDNLRPKPNKKDLSMSILGKVSLQICAKLNHSLWKLRYSPNIEKKRIMKIGISCSPKLIKREMKCYGYVANIQNDKYYSQQIIVKKNQSFIEKLIKLLRISINMYKKRVKSLPQYIILYRNGKGEGQIKQLFEIQVQTICQFMQSQFKEIQFSYFMICKKINQRFFAGQMPKLSNPEPGTVVSQDMSRYNFSFFLVPQNVNQGTCTPTMYVCLFNNTNLNENEFWEISYGQSHNYFNWPGAIRVPGVVQYANKLSMMISDHVCKSSHQQLCDSIYYI